MTDAGKIMDDVSDAGLAQIPGADDVTLTWLAHGHRSSMDFGRVTDVDEAAGSVYDR